MHNVAGKVTKISDNYYRIIKTRRPSVQLYKNIAKEEHFDALYLIEGLTNPRTREEEAETLLICPSDKYCGDNASLVHAPFYHFSTKNPNRFSDGSFGVFYCAKELECAVEETVFHTLKFLEQTGETSYKGQHRVLFGDLEGGFCDIRGEKLPEIYSTYDYSQSQKFGFDQKENGVDGISFDSVRYKSGECFAVFKPSVIKSIKEIKCFNYVLNDGKIDVKPVD